MNEPERLYLDTEVIHPAGRRKVSICRTSDTNIEYTRTDAFIEKAERYIRSIADGLDRDDDVETFISGFKNYMKGE